MSVTTPIAFNYINVSNLYSNEYSMEDRTIINLLKNEISYDEIIKHINENFYSGEADEDKIKEIENNVKTLAAIYKLQNFVNNRNIIKDEKNTGFPITLEYIKNNICITFNSITNLKYVSFIRKYIENHNFLFIKS